MLYLIQSKFWLYMNMFMAKFIKSIHDVVFICNIWLNSISDVRFRIICWSCTDLFRFWFKF